MLILNKISVQHKLISYNRQGSEEYQILDHVGVLAYLVG